MPFELPAVCCSEQQRFSEDRQVALTVRGPAESRALEPPDHGAGLTVVQALLGDREAVARRRRDPTEVEALAEPPVHRGKDERERQPPRRQRQKRGAGGLDEEVAGRRPHDERHGSDLAVVARRERSPAHVEPVRSARDVAGRAQDDLSTRCGQSLPGDADETVPAPSFRELARPEGATPPRDRPRPRGGPCEQEWPERQQDRRADHDDHQDRHDDEEQLSHDDTPTRKPR
jgi:hypothetical protein